MIKAWQRKLSLVLALVSVITVTSMWVPANVLASEGTTVVNIFSFNDFHGAVDKSASSSNPGADRFVAIVQELMSPKYGDAAAILAAGDNYQGSPLSNYFLGEPVSEMMKILGVKYSALGNHEFDWGAEYIYKFAKDGNVTFLAANIFDKGKDTRPDFVEPYGFLIFDEIKPGGKPLKIGIVGLTTTYTSYQVKAEYVEAIDFRKPGKWLTDMITELRTTHDCDYVIALTHMDINGTGPDSNTVTAITGGEVYELDDYAFDAIIGGHHHIWAAGTTDSGIPFVAGGFNGRGLGWLEFEFDDTTGLGAITPKFLSQSDMNTDAYLPSDPLQVHEAMKSVIEGFNVQAGSYFNKVVGKFGADIDIRDKMADWATEVVHGYIERIEGEKYILVQNAGGWRDVSPYEYKADQDVTVRFLSTLMPFDNEIILMEMEGKDIIYMLDLPVGVHTEDPGFPYLLSRACVSGAVKVDDIWYLASGDKIEEDKIYKIAANDFMLTGGDRFPFPDYPDFGNPYGADANVNVVGAPVIMGIPLRNAMIEELEYRLP